jgi:hypothetical protein
MLWKLRLVRLEYCSWPSILDPRSIILLYNAYSLSHLTKIEVLHTSLS